MVKIYIYATKKIIMKNTLDVSIVVQKISFNLVFWNLNLIYNIYSFEFFFNLKFLFLKTCQYLKSINDLK